VPGSSSLGQQQEQVLWWSEQLLRTGQVVWAVVDLSRFVGAEWTLGLEVEMAGHNGCAHAAFLEPQLCT
jgi:hypothetical protein